MHAKPTMYAGIFIFISLHLSWILAENIKFPDKPKKVGGYSKVYTNGNLEELSYPNKPAISKRILSDSRNYDNANVDIKPQSSESTSSISALPPNNFEVNSIINANPLLAAMLLNSALGIQPKDPGFNHPQHLSTNPYVALLLSHYGRYIPIFGTGRGIYGYNAENNYHNNKPFGAYKVYEDKDT